MGSTLLQTIWSIIEDESHCGGEGRKEHKELAKHRIGKTVFLAVTVNYLSWLSLVSAYSMYGVSCTLGAHRTTPRYNYSAGVIPPIHVKFVDGESAFFFHSTNWLNIKKNV